LFFTHKYVPFAALVIALLVIECFIYPVGNFALNDDWAYARSVYVWDQTGEFTLGKWPAMSLFSHSLLGLIFVKLFGFSYMVLRSANMCLCMVTLFFVYKFLLRRTHARTAVIICAIIVLNPFYLNIFNSFMTDLTFFNFSFLSFYSLVCYTEKRKWIYVLIFAVLAILATFTRQIGIILFAGFLCFSFGEFLRSRNKALLVFSVLSLALALVSMYFFEQKMMSDFSEKPSYAGLFFNRPPLNFGVDLMDTFLRRTIVMLVYSGAFFIVIGTPIIGFPLKEHLNRWKMGSLAVVIAAACFWYVSDVFPVGNVFYNCGLGVEGTVDRAYLEINKQHCADNTIYACVNGAFILGFFIFSYLIATRSSRIRSMFAEPLNVFVGSLLLLYSVVMSFSEAFFDRYSLYFGIFLLILFFQVGGRDIKFNRPLLALTLILYAVFSILATKDYFSSARAQSQIREQLIKVQGVDPKEIHAGLEYQLWDGTLHDIDWINFDHYADKKYTLGRGPIKGFTQDTFVTYRRYIPLKMDTIMVLRKD
jgi:hypothetical protein